MNPFTTYPYADISTAHVSQDDAKLIAEKGRDLYGIIATYPEGWFCWVPVDDWSPELVRLWESQGLSQSYIKLQRKLMESGITYARFDADGHSVTGIPLNDW